MKNSFIVSIVIIFILLISKSCVTPNINYTPQKIDTSKTLQTIAFGSCNKSDMPQDYWQNIGKTNPDLWIWLGDIIYADTFGKLYGTFRFGFIILSKIGCGLTI
jgi:hypothetical protein